VIAGSNDDRDGRDVRVLPYQDFVTSRPERPAETSPDEPAAEPARRDIQTIWAFEPKYYETVRLRREAQLADQPGPDGEPDASPPPSTGVTDELTDHNYDGIQEYDNPTPGWWYALFVGSVVFSLLYVFIYHMSTIVRPLGERHRMAEAVMLQQRFAELNKIGSTQEKIVQIMQEDAWLEQGASIFLGACAVCHGENGAGKVGPNLTDQKYKNVASLAEIADLIRTGTPDGAMPSQKNILNENEIALAAAYAASLRGKDLPTGDTVADQYRTGTTIPPWPTPESDDGMGVGMGEAMGGGTVDDPTGTQQGDGGG